MIFSRLRGQLSVYELRLLMRVVEFAQIEIQGLDISKNMGPNEHDLTGKVVEIPLMSVLSPGSHHYDRVLDAAKSMMKKLVEHYEPNGGTWKAACLVSAAESTKGEGCVRLYIQPWVWNAILDFTKGFVKFDLARALSLSSAHAVRLYFLMSNQQQPICYSFNELRKIFGLEGLYARGNDFVRKVLLPAKAELDEKQTLTDLLSSQKFITGVYNSDLLESATPEVAHLFLGLLEDEHRIQNELFAEMHSRGYYPIEPAEVEKLQKIKQQYAQPATV